MAVNTCHAATGSPIREGIGRSIEQHASWSESIRDLLNNNDVKWNLVGDFLGTEHAPAAKKNTRKTQQQQHACRVHERCVELDCSTKEEDENVAGDNTRLKPNPNETISTFLFVLRFL